MKYSVCQLKISWALLFFILLFSACTKKDDSGGTTNPGGPSNTTGTVGADSLSDHLQFVNAVKKQGNIPVGPANSSLKTSLKDTLYLLDQLQQPVKFLHTDTTKNITGVFLQVSVGLIGGPVNATYYYDVPETPELSVSDTVSEIMIGIDPTGYNPPLSFNITMVPYDQDGNPIAQAIRPVKLVKHTNDPNGTGGSCGLVLPFGQYWDWEVSYSTPKPPAKQFFSDPDEVYGKEGQMIKGSCCSGTSVYGICPKETQPNKSLHFATYYQIADETLTFFNDGTYLRTTKELGANPIPDSSNFCGTGEGIIKAFTHNTTYTGTYSIEPATLPADLINEPKYKNDNSRIFIQTSVSTPASSGFGNGGGIIHWIGDCNAGWLFLIQVDPEHFGNHLFKSYQKRTNTIFDRWYAFVL
jgi:hypothetical protein